MAAFWATLSKLGAIWSIIKGSMSLWKLIMNVRTVLKSWRAFKEIVGHLIAEKRLPAKQESVDLLEAVRVLFEKKIIDLPEDGEEKIDKSIKELQAEILKAA